MSEFSTSAKKHPYSSMRYSQTEFPSYYDNRRGNYGASYLAGDLARPRGEAWIETIPVENRYIDWVEQQKIEYMPIEKVATDHIEIEHRREYMPVPRLEKRMEYIPVERFDEKIDYVPYETSHVTKGSGLGHSEYRYGDHGGGVGYRSRGALYGSGYRGYGGGLHSSGAYNGGYGGISGGYNSGYAGSYNSGYAGSYGSGYGGYGYGYPNYSSGSRLVYGGYGGYYGGGLGNSKFSRPYNKYY